MRHCLRYIELAMLIPLVMVICTAFIVSSELANGVVSGKYFWFYTWIGISVAATTILFIIRHQQLRFSSLDLCVGLFWLGGIVAHLLSAHEINTKFVIYLCLGVLYILFRIVIVQRNYFHCFFIVSILATGLVEAIWGLRQLYGFIPSQHILFKTTGSFFNSGPYAGYLAMIVPMAFYYLIREYKVINSKFHRRLIPFYLRWGLSLASFVTILIILPSTMSRASWFASIGGCGVVGVMLFFRNHKIRNLLQTNKKLAATIFAGVAIVCIVGIVGVYNLKKDSADGRALIWKISTRAIMDKPIGVGLGRFAGTYGEYQAEFFKSGDATEQEVNVADSPDYTFNEYLQIGTELGVAPLLLFVAMLCLAATYLFRRQKLAEGGMLISFAIFASMSYPLSVLPFVILLVYVLAVGADRPTGSSSKAGTIGLLAGAVVLAALLVYNRYPTYAAYKTWSSLKRLHPFGIDGIANDYLRLKPLLNDNKEFLFECAQALAKAKQYEESNHVISEALIISRDPMFLNIKGKNNQALDDFANAEKSFIESSYMVPNRIYPHYLLAKLYLEAGDSAQAFAKARFVLDLEPKVTSPATDEIKQEIKKIINL